MMKELVEEQNLHSPRFRAFQSVLRRLLAVLPTEIAIGLYDRIRIGYRIVARGWATFASTVYDLLRYYRWSFVLTEPTSREQMRYCLRMRYHSLEKGLALPHPRPGFGAETVAQIVRLLKRYDAAYGCDDIVAVVINVLRAYQTFNRRYGIQIADLDKLISEYHAKYAAQLKQEPGGTRQLVREEITRWSDFDFEAFAMARCSIRNFTPQPVDPTMIEKAARIAQKSPSVCNRQSPRLHVFLGRAKVDQVLQFQGGNRGFGHTVPAVLIITADLQAFHQPGERYQAWIDGGLFAMSLIFGLHAQGLGTCCLNWSVTKDRDRAMRRATGIPDNEVVIMYLAVGHVPETLLVAQSPRGPLHEIIIHH